MTADRFGRVFRFERSSEVTLEVARTRATEALTRRGYEITADDGADQTGRANVAFTRGSRLRSIVAMSPDNWHVTGRISLDAPDDRDSLVRVTVEIDATRSAQVPSEAERAYWDREAAFLGSAAAGEDQVLPADTTPIRRQSLIAITILIGAVALGAIVGNRESDAAAAVIFAIIGLLAGCFIVWRWLGLSEERPTA